MKQMAVAFVILWCAIPGLADEASKTAKAEELLQMTQSGQMMRMLEPMKGLFSSQMGKTDMPAEERAKAGEMQEKLMALVLDRMSKAKPALAKIYTDTYTEEEIDGILAFYKSPAGRAMLQKMPEVMQRTMPLMIQMMGDLQPEMKKMIEEMKQKSK
jgi:uncharacterized protein